MIATVKNLAETAVLLPPKDRTYLAERLLASLEDSEIEQQWRGVAKRRRSSAALPTIFQTSAFGKRNGYTIS
jgi:hypothetical protein